MTRIDDALHSLGSAKYFSTMDLTSSYWQIELDDESKPRSAFVCRRGLFEFVRMPFGLVSAPACMQRLMDSVLAGLKWQTCLVYYLDDIICFSPTFDQHLKDLQEILLRRRSASLKIKLKKKCSFGGNRISFLGYVLSPDGLHTDSEKVWIVSDFPVPSFEEDVRFFLGLAGYYRSFTSNFSTPVLRFPDFSRPFELHTDGDCTAGIDVILGQRDPCNRRVYAVAYASISLSPAERNYGVSDEEVEALVIVWGNQKFAHYLTGTKFIVVTDHHALQFLRNSCSADLRGRLARWALMLQQMDFDIVYHPGKQNGGPDALRRPPVQRVSSKAFISTLNAAGLTSPQATDPFCVQIKAKSSLPKHFSPLSGVLFFNPRPFFLSLYKRKCSNCSMLAPSSGHHPGLG